jgi:CMP-N-acetylneuraminic acid synthetase
MLVAGKPLIDRTLEVALAVKGLAGIALTTDSPRIAQQGARPGVLVVQRPPELATDKAGTVPVVIHAVKKFESKTGYRVDAILLLQPTCPLRLVADVRKALHIFVSRQPADSLISCHDGCANHPEIMYRPEGQRLICYLAGPTAVKRRQDFDAVFIRNGAIYLSSRELVFEQHKLIGDRPLAYVMPLDRSINIDAIADLEMAEYFLKKRNKAG